MSINQGMIIKNSHSQGQGMVVVFVSVCDCVLLFVLGVGLGFFSPVLPPVRSLSDYGYGLLYY